jgi:hypothetical protein
MRHFESTEVLGPSGSRTSWREIRLGRLLAQNTELPRPLSGERGSRMELLKICHKRRVHNVTPWASDWVVHGPDWLGLLMFSRVPSVFKGWNTVRVPPRAQCFPGQRSFGPLAVHKTRQSVDTESVGVACLARIYGSMASGIPWLLIILPPRFLDLAGRFSAVHLFIGGTEPCDMTWQDNFENPVAAPTTTVLRLSIF